MSYSQLDRSHLIATVGRLHDRIAERFPDASLRSVAKELQRIASTHAERSAQIRRPVWHLRLWSALLLLGGAGLFGWLAWAMRLDPAAPVSGADGRAALGDTLQAIEAALAILFFLSAAGVYVASLELRGKRRRCLEALHELRALAHIVDMHQLTKDPERALHAGGDRGDTASSPERPLTPFLLTRYLDYCAEILSLIGKVAALYAQDFPDPQAVGAVDDIEDLTTGLSRKIWQKIMIVANHPAVEGGKP
ncbi:MAG: hypothetical protein WAT39_00375 [Planctomycetota bacterium]